MDVEKPLVRSSVPHLGGHESDLEVTTLTVLVSTVSESPVPFRKTTNNHKKYILGLWGRHLH